MRRTLTVFASYILVFQAFTPVCAGPGRSEGEITCAGSECALLWQRAGAWLHRHAGYRVAISFDTMVSIAGPHDYPALGPAPLMFIERLPAGDGQFRIRLHMECSYATLRCGYDRHRAAADFVAFLLSGSEPGLPAAAVRS